MLTNIWLEDFFGLCSDRMRIENFSSPAHDQMPLLNINSDVSSWVRGVNFGLRLHLHPYFVNARSKGSGKSAHLRRLA